MKREMKTRMAKLMAKDEIIEVYGVKNRVTQDGENATVLQIKIDASQVPAIQKILEISNLELLKITLQVIDPNKPIEEPSLFQEVDPSGGSANEFVDFVGENEPGTALGEVDPRSL
jgi:hypothetical protein